MLAEQLSFLTEPGPLPPAASTGLLPLLEEHLGSRIMTTFMLMDVCESEIAAAKTRYASDHTSLIHDAFRYLQPSKFLVNLPTVALYRAYCRQIIDRLVKGEDIRPATDAELLILCSETSLDAPLNGMGTYIYIQMFISVFGPTAVEIPERDLTYLAHHHAADAAVHIDSLRRQYTVERDIRDPHIEKRLTFAERDPHAARI